MPFAEGAFKQFVLVRALVLGPFFIVPIGVGAIDVGRVHLIAGLVAVEVPQSPILQIEFPNAMFLAFEVLAFAQTNPAFVERLKRPFQLPLDVMDDMPQVAIVVPGLPFAIGFALHVLACLGLGSIRQIPHKRSMLVSPVVRRG